MTQGAFCIILNAKNEVLLCHRRDKDLWNLPGGRVEENETPWDAIEREVHEEINVNIDIIRLIGVHYKPSSTDLVFTFLAKIKDGIPSLSSETDNIIFFNVNNIPTNTAPKQLERIKDFLLNGNNFMFGSQI